MGYSSLLLLWTQRISIAVASPAPAALNRTLVVIIRATTEQAAYKRSAYTKQERYYGTVESHAVIGEISHGIHALAAEPQGHCFIYAGRILLDLIHYLALYMFFYHVPYNRRNSGLHVSALSGVLQLECTIGKVNYICAFRYETLDQRLFLLRRC